MRLSQRLPDQRARPCPRRHIRSLHWGDGGTQVQTPEAGQDVSIIIQTTTAQRRPGNLPRRVLVQKHILLVLRHAVHGTHPYSAARAYSSNGAQVQIRFRSPYTLSTRLTGGQYFAVATNGSGNAACSRV
jgi:hypothetical protein